MEPLEEPRAAGDAIDRLTEESVELMKAVVATDAEAAEDDALKAHAELEEMLAALNEELNREQRGEERVQPAEVCVEEVIVVEVDEDGPWWIETKLGPWAARHQRALRVWLFVLLALYVTLFATMLVKHGVRGLSELSSLAMARDLLWVVLMAIVMLLGTSKRYQA